MILCATQGMVQKMYCRSYSTFRVDLFRKISILLNTNFQKFSDDEAVNILLYGQETLASNKNKALLTETILFIRRSNRFANTPA